MIRDPLLEKSILQSLHHPHIIRFRRVHENKNNVYMIMELMEGGSLQSYVQ
jgi:serine/threonine protein kinase